MSILLCQDLVIVNINKMIYTFKLTSKIKYLLDNAITTYPEVIGYR